MLTLALGATLIGFVLLILGLITGTVWLAVACIVICLLGLAFLLVDVFSGRNRDTARSLEDMVPGAGRTDETDDDDRDDAASGRARRDAGDESPTRRQPATPPGQMPGSDDETTAYRPPSFEPGMAAPSGPSGPGPESPESRPAPERREGNLEDYLRSVGEPIGPGADSNPTPAPGRGPAGPPIGGSRPTTGPQQPGARPSQPPQSGPMRSGPTQPGQRPAQYGTPPAGPGPQYGQPAGRQQPPSGQRPAWSQDRDTPRTDPASSGDGPPDEQTGSPEPRPGRRRAPDFDPLDPNWRPPLD